MNQLEFPAAAPAENIFARPGVLNLTPRQSTVVLGPLLEFLAKHKPHAGQVLLGIADKPWNKNDVRQLESLLVREIEDPVVVLDFLRVLRRQPHSTCCASAGNSRFLESPFFLLSPRILFAILSTGSWNATPPGKQH